MAGAVPAIPREEPRANPMRGQARGGGVPGPARAQKCKKLMFFFEISAMRAAERSGAAGPGAAGENNSQLPLSFLPLAQERTCTNK